MHSAERVVALLPVLSAGDCWGSPCHGSAHLCPQQGEAGAAGPEGPVVRHFQTLLDSFSLIFALGWQIRADVKTVWLS